MSDIDFSIIKVSVHSFHEKYIDSKTVTFFSIDINNIISNKQWSLEKRYSDFKTMNDILIQIYPKVPFIPGITLFKVTSFEELTKRRIELEEYLRDCIKRKDIFRSTYFYKFLELEKNSPELIGNDVTKVCDFNKLSFAVRDFIYWPSDQVLFVALSDMNVLSRMDSMFTNFTFFWETKSDSHVALGAICIYHVSPNKNIEENPNEFLFKKVWTSSFPSQVGPIDYDPISQVISVGLEDGKVCSFRHNPGMHFIDFREIFQHKVHNEKVTGIAYDKEMNCVYSCSTDKNFYTTDVNTKVSVAVGKSFFGYSNLKFDYKNERLFISNEYGQVKVFLTTSSPPKEVLLVQTSALTISKALTVDTTQNYIFVGTQMGKICILNLGLPGKERFITELSSFGSETGVPLSVICLNRNKNELICGDDEGRVCIWSLRTAKLLYAWLAHPNTSITQMYFDQDNQLLWTSGKDQAIRIWKFPEIWNSPKVEDFEQNQIHVISENLALARIQKAISKSQENEEFSDSSDDDLNGWEK